MTQLIRRRLSAEEKGEIWQRWKKGESLAAISRALSRTPPPIGQLVCRAGGIAPALRRRRPDALTLADREDISRGIAAQKSIRAIARAIGRPPSTVSRELNRNGKKMLTEPFRLTKKPLLVPAGRSTASLSSMVD